MKALLSGLILCLSINLYSQKAPLKFGEVSLDEIKMTRYEKDTSAAAVVLADYGVSMIAYNQNEGFNLSFERTTRIKILTKDGLKWADFEIPLYHEGANDEKISGLKAVTYNLDQGKIVESKTKPDGLFKEKYSENITLMKVALPNVKEGSVIELTYRVTSPFLLNFWDWEFQATIPTVHSEYRAAIPEYFNYDKYAQGYVGLTTSDHKVLAKSITLTSKERTGRSMQTQFNTDKIDYSENNFRWVARDVPAFKPEPFITTYKDYISKMNFELAYIKYPNQPIQPILGSWEEINKKYNESENFGKEITGNGWLKKTVEEITSGATTDEHKISAIYNYVQNSVSWDQTTQKAITGSLKKVVENKKGNSAEINLLLGSMLEKAGIQVHPVLLSTRDHGFLRESIPVTTQFNYVICVAEVNGKKILLDATDKFLPMGLIPERCLNGNGLVISKAGPSWVKLACPLKSKYMVTGDFAFDAQGALKGKLSLDRLGYSAHKSRKSYFAKSENDYVKDFIGAKAWEIAKSEFINTKEYTEAFKETHDLVINNQVVESGDMIYLNPFVSMQEIENPFKLEKREYPVDFGSPYEKMYVAKFMVPAGYKVEELPKAQIFVLPENGAKYLYNVTITASVINITSLLQINKSLFLQDEYENLREFYSHVVAKQAEQIVLKKI